MKLQNKILIVGLSLGSYSCASVGPDYEQPKIYGQLEKDKILFGEADSKFYSNEETASQWWKLFDEPSINAVVEEALKANTDLRIALGNLEKARGAISEVEGSRLPNTNLSASATRGVSASTASPITSNVGNPYPTLNTFDTGLSTNWDMDLFGRLRRTLESSRAEADAVEATYRLTRITVVANTVRAYTDACSVGKQIAVAEKSVSMQEEGVALVERNVKSGRGGSLDLARAKGLLAQLKSALPQLKAQKKLALFRLATLTGRMPQDFPAAAAQCQTFAKYSAKIPVGNGANLIARRPDVRIAERRLASATATIGIATASLYPSISFGASLGLTAHELDVLGREPSERFSIGPLVSWSFPNILGARARIRQAKAGAQVALANFDGVVINALRDIEGALVSYTSELQRNDELRIALHENENALSLSRRLFKAGVGNYLEVLDAERSLATADSSLASSDAVVAGNRVQLFLALGGGWQ
ncbi:MAG: TolC family protein [Bdellovibrionota bacterium]